MARQPCSELGRANCQLGVSLWVANDRASLPIAFDLYLPEVWTKDPKRRAKAGIPDEVGYRTKAEVALDQIRAAGAAGMPSRLVLARKDYRSDASFCAGLRACGIDYTVEIGESTTVWVDKLRSERTTSMRVLRRRGDEALVSVEDLAKALPEGRWHQARWSDSLGSEFGSRLAGFSVRRGGPATAAHKFADEWLVVERRRGNGERWSFWITTLPATTKPVDLVRRASLHHRVDRDAKELQEHVGLGHYEGRGWRGFRHHGSLCIAAYSFLVAERCRR